MNTVLLHFVRIVFPLIPETSCFEFKNILLRMCGVQIGKNVRICSSVKIIGNKELIIGNNTWIGPETFISASTNIYIGSNVDIALNVRICTGTHEIDPLGEHTAGKGITKPIRINNGAWICMGVNILAGVEIGEKSLIGAGSLINKNVPSKVVVGGVPYRILRHL